MATDINPSLLSRINERRVIEVRLARGAHVIDLRSELSPEWNLRIGPTRHAYFGLRVGESLRPSHGGRLTDAAGGRRRSRAPRPPGSTARAPSATTGWPGSR